MIRALHPLVLAVAGALAFAAASVQAQTPAQPVADTPLCVTDPIRPSSAEQRLAACRRVIAAATDPAAQAAAQIGASNAQRRLARYVEARASAEAAIHLDPRNTDAQVALGRAHAELAADDAAMAAYDAALKLDPKNADAHLARGAFWQFNLHDMVKARGEYQTALALDPTLATARYDLVLMMEDTDPQGALAAIEAAIRDFPDRIYLQRERASILDLLKRSDEARRALDDIVRAHPDDAGAYRVRAQLRAAHGDRGGGLADVEQAIKADPERAQAYLSKGYLLETQGRAQPALEAYAQAQKHGPDESTTFLALARVERSLGHADLAMAQLQAGLAIAPGDTDMLFQRGILWAEKSEPAKAIADYDRVVRRAPSAAIYYNRGVQLSATGEHARALADFQDAMRLDPKDPDSPERAGDELVSLDRNDEALKMFEAALVLKPDQVDALAGRGEFHARHSEWAQAAQDYEQALKVDPSRTGLLVALGEVWAELGRKDKAMAAYDRALRAKAGVARARIDRGDLMDGDGRSREALTEYAAAIKEEPDNVDALLDHARILRGMKDYTAARRDLDLALKLKPDSADVFNARGLNAWWAGDNPAAITEFDKATGRNADFGPAYYNRALVLVDDGRYDRAIRDLDAYLPLAPDDLDGPQLKAEVYRQLQDDLLAVELYDKVIGADPKRALAWWRRGLAKEAIGDAAGGAADKAQARRLDPKIS